MADTRPATGLNPTMWDDDYVREYFQENPWMPFMGTTPNSIIQLKEDFTKGKGDNMTLALVGRLSNDNGVEGTDILEGHEEEMDTRSFNFTVNKRRKAVRIAEMSEFRSSIDLRDAAKDVLMDYSQENTKKRIIDALGSINGVPYATATAAQRNTWLTDNSDRALFGSQTANSTSNVFATSLGNVDSTNDKLTAASLSLMKRMALKARTTAGKRKIAPLRVAGQNKRWFEVFASPLPFRDLKNDPVITQAQRDVKLEMENNRLFQGGDLVWDGMIIHEVDDMGVLTGVGNGGIDVGPVYLCGKQAMVYGIGKRWRTLTKKFDYEDKYGVAVEEISGLFKTQYGSGPNDRDNLVDHGIVSGWFSAVADA